MREVPFIIEPAVKAFGINVATAQFKIPEQPRRQGSELEKHIKTTVDSLDIQDLLGSPILAEYEALQRFCKVEKPMAPARRLLEIIERSGSIPDIGRLVNSYNIVSAQSGISLGAHDIDQIVGGLRLIITNGSESFIPLGASVQEPIKPGEFATVDGEKVLCRMDIRQSAETMVTRKTSNVLIYAQGNCEVSEKELMQALTEVRNNIVKFCGGTCLIEPTLVT